MSQGAVETWEIYHGARSRPDADANTMRFGVPRDITDMSLESGLCAMDHEFLSGDLGYVPNLDDHLTPAFLPNPIHTVPADNLLEVTSSSENLFTPPSSASPSTSTKAHSSHSSPDPFFLPPPQPLYLPHDPLYSSFYAATSELVDPSTANPMQGPPRPDATASFMNAPGPRMVHAPKTMDPTLQTNYAATFNSPHYVQLFSDVEQSVERVAAVQLDRSASFAGPQKQSRARRTRHQPKQHQLVNHQSQHQAVLDHPTSEQRPAGNQQPALRHPVIHQVADPALVEPSPAAHNMAEDDHSLKYHPVDTVHVEPRHDILPKVEEGSQTADCAEEPIESAAKQIAPSQLPISVPDEPLPEAQDTHMHPLMCLQSIDQYTLTAPSTVQTAPEAPLDAMMSTATLTSRTVEYLKRKQSFRGRKPKSSQERSKTLAFQVSNLKARESRCSFTDCVLTHVGARCGATLASHLAASHLEGQSLECDVCEKQFSRIDALRRHMRLVHKKLDKFRYFFGPDQSEEDVAREIYQSSFAKARSFLVKASNANLK